MIAFKRTTLIYIIYFCSGIPALFYQLVWQRSLYLIYGVTMESITLVVMGFMLGLGLGSLIGGWLSRLFARRLLIIFGLFEFIIGIFGIYSLSIFQWVGLLTLHLSGFLIFLITFLLVCLPTLLMGATLPLLTAHIVRVIPNVGSSVGTLYFFNTLGSALACIITALWTMSVLGQSGTVNLAAYLNILVGVSAFILGIQKKPRQFELELAIEEEENLYQKKPVISLPFAFFLSALTGYISLSYEILWIRLYNFISGGLASIFAVVLGFYLMGLASGALVSRFYCSYFREAPVLLGLLLAVLMTSILGYFLVPGISWVIQYRDFATTLSWIALVSTLIGMSFPLICHAAIHPDHKAGFGLSRIYFCNIMGSTIGSFVTGFVLTDLMTFSQINLFLSLLGLLISLIILTRMQLPHRNLRWSYTGIISFAMVITLMSPLFFNNFYEKLLYKNSYPQQKPFTKVIENKNGVVTVDQEGTVYGNGMYDGRFNIDPLHDRNGIFRAYAINAFASQAKEVLLIGLSSGSWAQVLAHLPKLEKLTIVEINPAYLQLISQNAQVASLLKNPKVKIVIDDGRRWLRRNPQRRFDLIVMNTTWHWRAFTSNLLSTDFLTIIRQALNKNGIFYYNTTSSKEVMRTAMTMFPYILRINNFIAVSDQPIILNKALWKSVLLSYKIDGQRVFDLKKKGVQQSLQSYLNIPMEWVSPFSQDLQTARVITDNNMGSEWVTGML